MILSREIECINVSDTGLVLLGFRAGVSGDPYGAFTNWNPNDGDPCRWSGVHCEDGVVKMV